MRFDEFLNYLKGKFVFLENGKTLKFTINNNSVVINTESKQFDIVGGIKHDHRRIFDLNKVENWSVLMFLFKLFEKGYSKDVIYLEKRWQLGHDDSGSLDIMLTNPSNNDIYMIEIKQYSEVLQYTNIENEKKLKQVMSYAQQERKTKILSFYAYNFEEDKDCFYNIYIDEILKEAQNVDDLFDRWNKIWDKSDYIVNSEGVFDFRQSIKKYEDLQNISNSDTKILFNQFSTILRLHSISDKPNAFIKMINLFLAKIADEFTNDTEFKVKDKYDLVHTFRGLKFQYINDIDTPESFMKRLNELYKIGMREYLNKEVIDYNDDEIEEFVKDKDNKALFEIFDNLRLKKNNNFSFLEVYDDATFYQNFEVVKDVVELLESFKFKYDTKHQFLGDFFEELLNTSLKQEAGQFFTPYPVVDFMVQSLPYEKFINEQIKNRGINILPRVIDYACGAGHFLISSMSYTQELINQLNETAIDLTNEQKRKVKMFKENPYCWVGSDNVVGIEKDYRLAKTTKIATFLNGDGDACIINGDGVNKFSSKDYDGTVLHSNKKKIEKFDFLISNPPYSIEGFMRNFIKNNITPESNDFSLLESINFTDTAIEKYFVERMEQLLTKNGYAAIVLPQSILSGAKYEDVRKFLFDNFEIKAMLLTADITFSGTTTSPVVLFLKKCKRDSLNYETLIMCSPKYSNPTGSKMKTKEVEFLGYEFSSNRSKTGTDIKDTSILQSIIPILNNVMSDKEVDIPQNLKNYVYKKKISNIILNKTCSYNGDIYPKYIIKEGDALNKYCKINARKESDFNFLPDKYVEISNMNDLQSASKKKTTTRYCKNGDILISSLCPTVDHIVISDGNYMLSTAIHVLSGFKNDEERDKVYNALIHKDTIAQMNTMLDGFKITYAKISEQNLYNNVLINV